MIFLNLSSLLSSLSDARLFLPYDPAISFLTPDPERVREQTLYLCIRGFHRDGHDALPSALKRGAVACVIGEDRPDAAAMLRERGIPFAVVPNDREAEAILTSRFYSDPWKEMKITAVTGTNGKTSVVSMLSSIYETAGCRTATIGTLTGAMTTPDPAELYPLLAEYRKSGVTHVFMEASSHALALYKLAPIRFDTAVFTNLSPEHLDFHRTMEEYAAAKAKLFAQAERSLLNADDPYATVMAEAAAKDVYLCSAKEHPADFSARGITHNGAYGISYDFAATDRRFRIRSPIPGQFTVMNTLQAAAKADLDGIPQDVIRGALCRFCGVKGRLERISLPTRDFSVYIDFAHTPDALRNILLTLRSLMQPSQRLVLLFGCGGDRDKAKRPMMGQIASQLSDFVIVTSDNSRSETPSAIIADILEGFDEHTSHTVIENRAEAIRYAVESADIGDVILLAGKGHEEYQISSDGKHPFSERELVISATRKYLKDHGLF